jgi:hypothetical protein
MGDSKEGKGFNDSELADIISEIENLEDEFDSDSQGMDAFDDSAGGQPETDNIAEQESESEEVLTSEASSEEESDDIFQEMEQINEISAMNDEVIVNDTPIESDETQDTNASKQELEVAKETDLDSLLDEAAEVQSSDAADKAYNAHLDKTDGKPQEVEAKVEDKGQLGDILNGFNEEKPKLFEPKDSISGEKLDELEQDLLAIDSVSTEDEDELDDDDLAADIANEIDQELDNLESFESELDKNLEEELKKQSLINEGENSSSSLEIVNTPIEKIATESASKEESKSNQKPVVNNIQDEVENELKNTLGDLSTMNVENVVPIGGSKMNILDDRSAGNSNSKTTSFESNKKPEMPSGEGATSKMDFSVAGNMTVALGFHLDSQSVNITLNQENLTIELSHGATFSIPVNENSQKLKKAS